MPVETLIKAAIAEIDALSPAAVRDRLDEFLIVDVREPGEVLQGFLPAAINVPRGVLEFRVADDAAFRDPARPILLYSNLGRRAALAARCLKELGFARVAMLEGGITAWAEAGLPIE